MNIKKSKIALALSGLLFLSVPVASAFADEKHNEMKEMQMGGTMAQIKSELRGYVKGVKSDDAQMMQQHLSELLKLSTLSTEHMPESMQGMDHSNMEHGGMEMDHSNMEHGDMDMEHSNMNHADMDMDHSNMDHDMSDMTAAQHQHMMYMQSIAGLNDLFKQLGKTQDKTEIKLILGKIKEQIKKNQQLFS